MKNLILLLASAVSFAAAPPTTVTFMLAAGESLPRITADIESITIEPVGACRYHYGRTFSITGPTPWSTEWWASGRYRVTFDGGEFFAFDGFGFGGQFVMTSSPQRLQLGPFEPSAATSPTLTINDDRRCDLFEGSGNVDLYWGALLWMGMQSGGHAITWGPPEVWLEDFGLRVTYTLR